MKKETKILNGKKHYLLGTRKEDGLKVWLQMPSWNCGWYWGFGYIEIYSKNQKTLYLHTHFDSLFFNGNGKKCCFDLVKEYFKELTINNNELWALLDYMKTFYTLRKASDAFHIGGSHISSNLNYKCTNDEMYNLINKTILPNIFKEVENLLE